ncbi:3',5'-cyclic-nucleotide phosphodiesterase regA [Podospora fimiseda]|uniref:Phosphodiesterase n=1 Tax=Podospora fimiseda TaxID=252190 RepID=A0AAN7H7B6_9PEZI|nr:3',5'-cyclic-nucleotide phosphodiesterase regA [Podospora fimiseda]
MEKDFCNVIYVDRAVCRDRHVEDSRRDDGSYRAESWESEIIKNNVDHVLRVYGRVYLCSTGGACLNEWLKLHEDSTAEPRPTIFLLETPYQEQISQGAQSRPASECENQEGELYGLPLLKKIRSEASARNLSKLIIIVPVVTFPDNALPNGTGAHGQDETEGLDETMMRRYCIELGAKTIVRSPIGNAGLLDSYAWKAHRKAMKMHQARHKPYAYLGEEMVKNLTSKICSEGSEGSEWDGLETSTPNVSTQRRDEISLAISKWAFCSPKFNDDELAVAACIIFEHALAMPELEKWRIPPAQLHAFIVACRKAYNKFVAYHNFCHVVDVLQATFHILVEIGAFPPLRATNDSRTRAPSQRSPMAKVLRPFEGLMLLVTAIGHDVGHPGVNNGFLTKLKAPLAQLYNDKSVLENFHCAAYNQILRMYWPQAYSDPDMRCLVLGSILATDMSLHFEYMGKLTNLKDALDRDNGSTDSWKPEQIKERTALTCALLIKCADISNVARKHDTAIRWMHTLSEECSRQREMENELNLDSSLFSYSGKDILKLTESQLNFMKSMAKPLFDGIADILPELGYCRDELCLNEKLFEQQKEEAARSLASHSTRPTEVPPLTMNQEQMSNGFPLSSPDRQPDSMPVNGISTSFDNAASHSPNLSQQRRSETTEGSSVPYNGDWSDHGTSVTNTNKMPLSPSTQGTSILSHRDSSDRPNSLPVTSLTAPDSSTARPDSTSSQDEHRFVYSAQLEDDGGRSSNGYTPGSSPGWPNGLDTPDNMGRRVVRKKSSRWESLKKTAKNVFSPRNKTSSTSSPPLPPGDVSG